MGMVIGREVGLISLTSIEPNISTAIPCKAASACMGVTDRLRKSQWMLRRSPSAVAKACCEMDYSID